MNQIVTLLLAGVLCHISQGSFAQYSENFESDINSLSGNCWQIVQLNHTSDGGSSPINGTGSLYSQPPTNGSSTRDVSTPYLNIPASLQVSFKYKLSSALNGNATRTIEIGLKDSSGNFISLQSIVLDKNSSASTQSYSNTFVLTSTGIQRLVFRLGGSTGDGNSRLLFDDLSTNASSHYGPSTTCNSAPVAINDTYSGINGNPVSGNVMINDNDPDGEFIKPSIVATSNDGTVVFKANGSFTFTPNPGFTGSSTTFTYRLTDEGISPMTSNTATVTINFSEGILLPVKLFSFQGNMAGNSVKLIWVVDENKNAKRFEIEKSYNGTDFSLAGTIQATGTTGKESYSFKDDSKFTGKVIYRLKILGHNNNAELSRILVFQQEITDKIKIVNPVNDKLTLSYSAENNESVSIKIFDMAGHLHMNLVLNICIGSNIINLPLSPSIKKGIYIVNVNDGRQSHISKIAKLQN
jgi:hypothetical protein